MNKGDRQRRRERKRERKRKRERERERDRERDRERGRGRESQLRDTASRSERRAPSPCNWQLRLAKGRQGLPRGGRGDGIIDSLRAVQSRRRGHWRDSATQRNATFGTGAGRASTEHVLELHAVPRKPRDDHAVGCLGSRLVGSRRGGGSIAKGRRRKMKRVARKKTRKEKRREIQNLDCLCPFSLDQHRVGPVGLSHRACSIDERRTRICDESPTSSFGARNDPDPPLSRGSTQLPEQPMAPHVLACIHALVLTCLPHLFIAFCMCSSQS
jgi:hypothetical protein